MLVVSHIILIKFQIIWFFLKVRTVVFLDWGSNSFHKKITWTLETKNCKKYLRVGVMIFVQMISCRHCGHGWRRVKPLYPTQRCVESALRPLEPTSREVFLLHPLKRTNKVLFLTLYHWFPSLIYQFGCEARWSPSPPLLLSTNRKYSLLQKTFSRWSFRVNRGGQNNGGGCRLIH